MSEDKEQARDEIVPVASENRESSPPIPDELAELMADMPPAIRSQFLASFGSFQMRGGRAQHPLFDKFTDAHVDKYLDYIQRDDDNAHELRRTNRWFYLAYFLIVLVAFGIGVAYLLPRDKDFLEQLIEIIVILAGGIGAGYGLKSSRDE